MVRGGRLQGGVAPPEVVDRLADASVPAGAWLRRSRPIGGPWGGTHAGALDSAGSGPPDPPGSRGVVGRLDEGIRVVDVGCGAGVALLTMAAAFPKATFEGFDPSRHAIDRARHRLAGTELTNVEFQVAPAEDLPARPDLRLRPDPRLHP